MSLINRPCDEVAKTHDIAIKVKQFAHDRHYILLDEARLIVERYIKTRRLQGQDDDGMWNIKIMPKITYNCRDLAHIYGPYPPTMRSTMEQIRDKCLDQHFTSRGIFIMVEPRFDAMLLSANMLALTITNMGIIGGGRMLECKELPMDRLKFSEVVKILERRGVHADIFFLICNCFTNDTIMDLTVDNWNNLCALFPEFLTNEHYEMVRQKAMECDGSKPYLALFHDLRDRSTIPQDSDLWRHPRMTPELAIKLGVKSPYYIYRQPTARFTLRDVNFTPDPDKSLRAQILIERFEDANISYKAEWPAERYLEPLDNFYEPDDKFELEDLVIDLATELDCFRFTMRDKLRFNGGITVLIDYGDHPSVRKIMHRLPIINNPSDESIYIQSIGVDFCATTSNQLPADIAQILLAMPPHLAPWQRFPATPEILAGAPANKHDLIRFSSTQTVEEASKYKHLYGVLAALNLNQAIATVKHKDELYYGGDLDYREAFSVDDQMIIYHFLIMIADGYMVPHTPKVKRLGSILPHLPTDFIARIAEIWGLENHIPVSFTRADYEEFLRTWRDIAFR